MLSAFLPAFLSRRSEKGRPLAKQALVYFVFLLFSPDDERGNGAFEAGRTSVSITGWRSSGSHTFSGPKLASGDL